MLSSVFLDWHLQNEQIREKKIQKNPDWAYTTSGAKCGVLSCVEKRLYIKIKHFHSNLDMRNYILRSN